MLRARSFFTLLLIVGLHVVAAFRVARVAAQRHLQQSRVANIKPVASLVATPAAVAPVAATAETASFVETESRTELVVGLEAEAGHLLGQRFVLEHFVESRSLNKSPGEVFPDLEGFSDPKHLGSGASGDVWEAYDVKLKRMVAVKIFHSRTRNEWLTWNSATTNEKDSLEKSIEECVLVQNMLKQSYLYPQGASRICECYEEHVSQYKNTDELLFLVLEMCGRDLDDIGSDLEELDGTTRIAKARQLTEQLLEAIAFMNMLDPPLIHHDLKPNNVVALEGTDFNVKLIDFGTFVWATPENQNLPSRGAQAYLAPEWNSRSIAFMWPAHSFDMYGVGLIHALLACPNLKSGRWNRKWLDWYPAWAGEDCPGLPTADLDFIQSLTNIDYTQRPAPWVALKDEMFSES